MTPIEATDVQIGDDLWVKGDYFELYDGYIPNKILRVVAPGVIERDNKYSEWISYTEVSLECVRAHPSAFSKVAKLKIDSSKLPGAYLSIDDQIDEITKAISETSLSVMEVADPLAEQAEKFPAYWKPLPKNWRHLDYYRVRELFPLEVQSARLDHAMKKLLVPGVRTGGKSFYKDIAEAHATIGQWLADNKHLNEVKA